MRIWHESLIPKLCRQHLLACWREGLGCYAIITQNKKGYRNHPAVKEFSFSLKGRGGDYTGILWNRLLLTRQEMIKRGYNPKEMPEIKFSWVDGINTVGYEPWQTLKKQIEVLKEKRKTIKSCKCNI